MPNRNLLSSIWAMRELTKLTTDFWIFERNMPWVDMKKWKNHKKKERNKLSHHTLCGLFFHLLRLFHHVDFYSARLFRSRQFGHGTTTQAQVPNRLHCTRMLRRFLFFNKPLHWSFLFVYKSDICFLVDFSCLFFIIHELYYSALIHRICKDFLDHLASWHSAFSSTARPWH